MPSFENTYMVGIRNVADYSPFGVELDGRTESGGGYRYSFQGQEKDDEVKGEGNSINYKYRMHDPRVGRFFAVDPLDDVYPDLTTYQFSHNSVIALVELEGKEGTSSESRSLEDVTPAQTTEDPIVVAPVKYWGPCHDLTVHRSGTDSEFWPNQSSKNVVYQTDGMFFVFIGGAEDLTLKISDGEGGMIRKSIQSGEQELLVWDYANRRYLFAKEQSMMEYWEANSGGSYIPTPDELLYVENAQIAIDNGTASLDQINAVKRYHQGLPATWNATKDWFWEYGYDEQAAKFMLLMDVASIVIGEAPSARIPRAHITPRTIMNNLQRLNTSSKTTSGSVQHSRSNNKSMKRKRGLKRKREARRKKHRKT